MGVSANWRHDPLVELLGWKRLSDRPHEEAMQPLKVDPDVAFDISRSVRNEAVELHYQLVDLQRDWGNLARGWSNLFQRGSVR